MRRGDGDGERSEEAGKEEQGEKNANPVQFCRLTRRIPLPPAPARSGELQDKLLTGSWDDASHAANWLSPPLSAALRIYSAAADTSRTDVLRRQLTLTSPPAPPTPSTRPSSSSRRQEYQGMRWPESVGLSIMATFDYFFAKILLSVLPARGAKEAANNLLPVTWPHLS